MCDTGSTWKKFLAEWLTIFISISAAFALDRWNDARKENELEAKSIHALIQEIQSDTSGLSNAIGRSRQTLNVLSRFNNMIRQNNVPQDSSSVFAVRMLNISNFASTQTTYDMLKSSGGLSAIRDFEVRKLLISTYSQFENRTLIETIEQNYLQTHIIPILFETIDFSALRSGDPLFYKSMKFRNTLLGTMSLIQQKISYYDECLISASELHKRLVDYEKIIQ